MEKRLFIARTFTAFYDQSTRTFSPSPRCWFFTHDSASDGLHMMQRYLIGQSERQHYQGLTTEYDVPDEEMKEIEQKIVFISDPSERAAWVSRIDNIPLAYDENTDSWHYSVPDDSEILSQVQDSDNIHIKVLEISEANGFRDEEISIGWQRAVFIRIEQS